MREKVLVAMSGGVDSSVAAARLVEQGYDVVGATMKLFCYGDAVPDRPCCSLDSINDARDVARRSAFRTTCSTSRIAFDLHVIDEFRDRVRRGRTPIPCVRCNTFTKFRDLLAHADALGCERIATGHYAVARDGAPATAVSTATRTRAISSGESTARWSSACSRRWARMTKAEDPAPRAALGLTTADKPESVEICFVPDDDYAGVLERHLPADAPALVPGPLVSTSGEVLGEHAATRDTPLASGAACPAVRARRDMSWRSGRRRGKWWSGRPRSWRDIACASKR